MTLSKPRIVGMTQVVDTITPKQPPHFRVKPAAWLTEELWAMKLKIRWRKDQSVQNLAALKTFIKSYVNALKLSLIHI